MNKVLSKTRVSGFLSMVSKSSRLVRVPSAAIAISRHSFERELMLVVINWGNIKILLVSRINTKAIRKSGKRRLMGVVEAPSLLINILIKISTGTSRETRSILV